MIQRFNVGDIVSWKTKRCARGYVVKCGRIVEVVQPGVMPSPIMKKLTRTTGLPRDHLSYIVHVPNISGRGVGKYHWPLSDKLTRETDWGILRRFKGF
jgi:hypothetical protein